MESRWKPTSKIGEVSVKWDTIQADRFIVWANHHLQKRSLQVKDLSEFADGVLLLNLLEEASGKKIARYIKTPKFLQHKIENVTIALNFVEKLLDVKMVGCNAKDIADGNIKQIMALMFMLVQKAKPGTIDREGLDVGEGPVLQPANPNPAPPTPTPATDDSKTVEVIIKSKDIIANSRDPGIRARANSNPAKPAATPVKSSPAKPAPKLSPIKDSEASKDGADVRKPEIKPEEVKPEVKRPTEEVKPVEQKKPAPVEKKPVAQPKPAAQQKPIAQPKPTEEKKPVEEKKVEQKPPAAEQKPIAQPKPTEVVSTPQQKEEPVAKPEPVKEEVPEPVPVTPAPASTPEPEPTPVTIPEPEPTPVPEAKPVVEATPAPEEKPVVEEAVPAPVEKLEPEPAPVETKVEPEAPAPVPVPVPVPEEKPVPVAVPAPVEPKTEEKPTKKETPKRKTSKSKDDVMSPTRAEQIQNVLQELMAVTVYREAHGEEDDGEEIKFEIRLDAVVSVQASIRQYLARAEYVEVRDKIHRRKKELEDEFKVNLASLRIIVKFQATIRGRIERRKIRRNLTMYRRNEIAKEIVSTEKKFVHNLDILCEKFVEPLKKMLTPTHIRNLFSNVEVIRNYNRQLCTRLEERMANWYTSGQRLGDIFNEMTDFLKVYTMYVNNYNTSIATMTQLIADNSKFAVFLEKNRSAPECMGLDFAAFLIQPIQRLPRYVLLLQDLCKHTHAGHPDYEKLNQALKKMKDVADYVNERKREAENLTQVLAIQAKLTGKFDNLAEPHRRYVRKGSLAMLDERGNIKTLFFFLFNDILVYTENKSASKIFRGSFGKTAPNWDEAAFNNGRFKFIGQIALAGMGGGLADVPDSEKDKILCAFQLVTPTASILLMGMNPDEKLAWMNDLDECINQLLEKERSRKFSHLSDIEEAIHQKCEVSEPNALDISDYSGHLHKKGNNDEWKQKWFLLRDGMLYYFSEKPNSEQKEPHAAKSINLIWCSVKVGHAVGRPCVLQLATPARIFFLSAPDYRSMFQWIYVLRLAIVQQIAAVGEPESPEPDASEASATAEVEDSSSLAGLLKSPANRACADCSAPDPSWVSTSLGVFVCVECSGIHRRLPPGVSVLKSLRALSSSDSIDLKTLGNAQANAKYEKNAPAFMQKPCPSDPYDIKVNWIRAKYLDEKQLAAIPSNRRLSTPVNNAQTNSNNNNSPSNTTPTTSPTSTSPSLSQRSISPTRDLAHQSIRRKGSGVFEKVSKNKEGNLYKRQGALLQDEWKLYRFVLRDGHLVYYKPKGKKESGTIDLLLCGVRIGDTITQTNDRPKYIFEIIAPTRIYMLAAETKEARDEWVQSINVCIVTALAPL